MVILKPGEREKDVEGGVIIKIKVKPNSGRFRFYVKNDEYVVEVKSKPQQGKANEEILREFKKIFKTNVQILYGKVDKTKVMFIEGISLNQLHQIMKPLSGES